MKETQRTLDGTPVHVTNIDEPRSKRSEISQADCPDCDGTGRMLTHHDPEGVNFPLVVACPKCSGLGRLPYASAPQPEPRPDLSELSGRIRQQAEWGAQASRPTCDCDINFNRILELLDALDKELLTSRLERSLESRAR